MAGHIITVKLTRAQARALTSIVDDITAGHEVTIGTMDEMAYARAVVASKRLMGALRDSAKDNSQAVGA